MSLKRPLVSVIVITWNRKDEVKKCLESVFAQSYPRLEVIVIDNASVDGTADKINSLFPQVKLIKLPRNLGVAEGRNVGFANAKGEILFSLDDDGWLEKDAVEKVIRGFQGNPEAGVIQIKIIDGRLLPSQSCYLYEFSGGASAIKREVLERVGFYPHDFFRQAEESDLSMRIIEAGYNILYLPEAVMYHRPSPVRQNVRAIAAMREINSTRIAVKYYPLPYAISFVLFRWPRYIAKAFLRGQFSALKDLFLVIPAIFSAWKQRKPMSSAVFKQRQALKKQWAANCKEKKTAHGN